MDRRHLAKNVETLSLGVGLGMSGTIFPTQASLIWAPYVSYRALRRSPVSGGTLSVPSLNPVGYLMRRYNVMPQTVTLSPEP